MPETNLIRRSFCEGISKIKKAVEEIGNEQLTIGTLEGRFITQCLLPNAYFSFSPFLRVPKRSIAQSKRVKETGCLLPIIHCLLLISPFLFSSVRKKKYRSEQKGKRDLLPIVYCLLPIAYCPLLIAYCLLPIPISLFLPAPQFPAHTKLFIDILEKL